jgi:hypothetical protein
MLRFPHVQLKTILPGCAEAPKAAQVAGGSSIDGVIGWRFRGNFRESLRASANGLPRSRVTAGWRRSAAIYNCDKASPLKEN